MQNSHNHLPTSLNLQCVKFITKSYILFNYVCSLTYFSCLLTCLMKMIAALLLILYLTIIAIKYLNTLFDAHQKKISNKKIIIFIEKKNFQNFSDPCKWHRHQRLVVVQQFHHQRQTAKFKDHHFCYQLMVHRKIHQTNQALHQVRDLLYLIKQLIRSFIAVWSYFRILFLHSVNLYKCQIFHSKQSCCYDL